MRYGSRPLETFRHPAWVSLSNRAKELRERGWTATIHPDDIDWVRDSWHDAVARGGSADFEMRLRRNST
ncbi:PAS domain-containing protein [Rhizobium leguminosarum bv. viciae]|uniref:PAS domain-containing protein n=1 Tax=Rhizobium leguminosarum bv. viciae TaxID=387 RepID=A0A8I2GTQ1_RHILV|nr:PAS domain-containing protein [Rhizobium leguminosarum bv. viciae]